MRKSLPSSVQVKDVTQSVLLLHWGDIHPKDKVYIYCGPQFGPEFEAGHAVIVRALYSLKSSAHSWRSFLAQRLLKILMSQWAEPTTTSGLNQQRKPTGPAITFMFWFTQTTFCVWLKIPKWYSTNLINTFFWNPSLEASQRFIWEPRLARRFWEGARKILLEHVFTDLRQRVSKERWSLSSKAASGIEI